MDAFKGFEIKKMELGGNEGWKTFWEEKNPGAGKWDDKSVSPEERVKRYDSDEGEEWKERLSCRVEGREFTGVPERTSKKPASSSSGAGTPSRTDSPARGIGPRSQKQQNESFFEKMGNANASRPEGLAPSQGGKYAGFGSAPPEPPSSREQASSEKALPGLDDFEKNPMGAITQGLGWFASSVTRQAKNVNEGYIKPTAQKVSFHLPILVLPHSFLLLLLSPSSSHPFPPLISTHHKAPQSYAQSH